MGDSSNSTDVDALFKLPLGEFTSARNALVTQLKKAGRQAEAGQAKALAKPSVSAWVVNQLYWRQRQTFDRLMEAGKRLRRVHAAGLAGDAARDAVNARREAVTELVALATDLLRDGHIGATRDLTRRVTTTLEALSSYASASGAPAAGRLTEDVEPPGFEALVGFQAPLAATSLRRADRPRAATSHVEAERKAAVAAAKIAVRDAARTLGAARKQAKRAAAKLETASTHAKAIEAERARIEKRLARIANDAEAAQAQVSQAATTAKHASHAADEAERDLELARRRLQQMAGNED